MSRLNHIYGENHHEKIRYNQEENERRQREDKKQELKKCLAKYVSKGSHNEMVAKELVEAQAVLK